MIFHPNSLATSDEELDALTHLIVTARRNGLWIAPARDVARFVAEDLDRTSAKAA